MTPLHGNNSLTAWCCNLAKATSLFFACLVCSFTLPPVIMLIPGIPCCFLSMQLSLVPLLPLLLTSQAHLEDCIQKLLLLYIISTRSSPDDVHSSLRQLTSQDHWRCWRVRIIVVKPTMFFEIGTTLSGGRNMYKYIKRWL